MIPAAPLRLSSRCDPPKAGCRCAPVGRLLGIFIDRWPMVVSRFHRPTTNRHRTFLNLPRMQPANCLNCNHALYPGQKFCDRCGQKTDVHRLTVGHLFHELFHAVTHTDKSIFHLFKGLALHPGKVAAEYVEGKRKKYFNPFTFLLLCIGFMIFVNNMVKPYPELKADPNIVRQIPTEAGRKLYIRTIERTNNATQLVNKNTNLVYLIAIPFYALIVWLFYRWRGRNFAEIVLAFVLFTGFVGTVFTIVFTPLMAYNRTPSNAITYGLGGTFLFIVYYAWGFKGFLRYKSAKAFIHLFFVLVLTMLLWFLITLVFYFWYIYDEQTVPVLKAVWKKLTG